MIVMIILGSHTSFANNQLLGCVKEAIDNGANTFMFYTGAPQNSIRKPINKEYLNSAYELMKENNIDINNIVCHVPYIVNLANPLTNAFGTFFLNSEIERCEILKVKKLILHPGSATNITKVEGIKNIITCLNKVITKEQSVTILLETMAGKGNEIGSNIEELMAIIDGIDIKDKIGVCLDTCHINDAGYKFDEYLELFDKMIGIERIGCIHLNDSKNEMGTHKDRHENIGYGMIGFDKLLDVVYNERLKKVPKILETPYFENNYSPYKLEIKMIKTKAFNPNFYDDIKDNF